MRVPEVDGTIDRPRICGCDVVSAIEEPAFPVPAVPAWLGGETPVRCTSVKLRKVAPGRPHGLDHRCAAIRPVGVKVQEYAVGHRAETSNEGSQLESADRVQLCLMFVPKRSNMSDDAVSDVADLTRELRSGHGAIGC